MKKILSLILIITALICSRTMLSSFNDPEGPNLLIVIIMAIIIYFLSLIMGRKRFILTIFSQVIIAILLYFLLR